MNDDGNACKYPKLYKKYDIDLGKTSEFKDGATTPALPWPALPAFLPSFLPAFLSVS